MVTNNVSSAIVDADALDLDLRMSQPHAPESKRGNIMAGLQLPFPESSSAMVNQVRKLEHLRLRSERRKHVGILQVSFPVEIFPSAAFGTKERQSQFLRKGNLSFIFCGKQNIYQDWIFSGGPRQPLQC
jgi:hypothetical protein